MLPTCFPQFLTPLPYIYFNDKSRGELLTFNSCRRDNMEKRERERERETRAHTHTHTHTHACTHAHTLTLDRKEW